jgi:hypothetical protein
VPSRSPSPAPAPSEPASSKPSSRPGNRPVARGSEHVGCAEGSGPWEGAEADEAAEAAPALCSSDSGVFPTLGASSSPSLGTLAAANMTTAAVTSPVVAAVSSGGTTLPVLRTSATGSGTASPVGSLADKGAYKENSAMSVLNAYTSAGVTASVVSKPAPPVVEAGVEESAESTVVEEISRRKNERSSFMAKHRTHIVSKCHSLAIESSTVGPSNDCSSRLNEGSTEFSDISDDEDTEKPKSE